MPRNFSAADLTAPSPAAILLDSGCCPCPQGCGCTGLYSPKQFFQGPGATDAQAAPFRRLPWAKLDFTLTYAPNDLYLYYVYGGFGDPVVRGRSALDLSAAVGVNETLTLDSAAYNASYPAPFSPVNPTLVYQGAHWFTDGTFVNESQPFPAGDLFDLYAVRRDFFLANGMKVRVNFNIADVGCESTGQATNGYPAALGMYLFDGALPDGSPRMSGGCGASDLRTGAGVPLAGGGAGGWLALWRLLFDADMAEIGPLTVNPGALQPPYHASWRVIPGFGWRWLFHD
jgi:hypothetical protein